MKQNNIEKSSAELLEYIETLIADVPAPKESEVNKGIKEILSKVDKINSNKSQFNVF